MSVTCDEIKINKMNSKRIVIKDDDEDDYEEEPCCYGKHCSETRGLKRGLAFNRDLSYGDFRIVTENLFCKYCYEIETKHECKSCLRNLPYTKLNYREGGLYGRNNGGVIDNFFCNSCCHHIESVTSYGMDDS